MPKVSNFRDQTQKEKRTISQNLSSLQKNLLETKITFLTALSQKCSAETEKNWHSKSENISKKSVYWSNFHLGKKHAISKVVSKNKTNSFILFRSRPEIIQKVLFFVP